jgi:hypothetical protein
MNPKKIEPTSAKSRLGRSFVSLGGRFATAGGVAFAAVALALLFWWPLFGGAGFIGGDVYSYYLPQKVVYAEDLAAHRLPLWNNRAGHGYPIVGESQTGPFYPANLFLYSLLPINLAYNANHLLHYLLAFAFTWLYARSLALSRWASGLAALVYVYGWFPSRSCWEWAIIGGAWMPAAFWCAEKFLSTRLTRFAFGLCAVLTVQLLAGHFNLAFFTQITLVPYVLLRLAFANRDLPDATRLRSKRVGAIALVAVVSAFGLAALQLGPTWELKQLSQRQAPGEEHNLAHGSIPLSYWSQMVEPWYWYSPYTDRDDALRKEEPALGARTNQVEAHLYFGLIPLMLALTEAARLYWSRDRVSLIWFVLSVAALVYTTGWLLGVARYIPGFDFFQGPGRYGVITTLGVAILAAKALDHWRNTGSILLGIAVLISFGAAMWTALALTWQGLEIQRAANGAPNPFQLGPFVFSEGLISGLLLLGLIALILAVVAQLLNRDAKLTPPARVGRWTLVACVLMTSVVDLWLVSRVVTYSNMVADPPIDHLANSPVRQFLGARPQPSRVFAPGANLPSALAAATPVYLTFGPVEYVDPQLVMPENPLSARIEWLRRAGVTHVLSFNPLNESEWPVRSVWQGFDPLLNPAWARYREPLYLYELKGGRGRVAWEKPAGQSVPQVTELSPSRITIDTDSSGGGRLILTELMYPGWRVAIDGKEAPPLTIERMYRGVDVPSGRHQVVWSYHPRSLYWGLAVSTLTLLILAAVAHVAYWHPQRLKLAAEDSPQ